MIKNNNYEDIINLPHHVSKKHKQMSMQARAAQFSPFQPLTVPLNKDMQEYAEE